MTAIAPHHTLPAAITRSTPLTAGPVGQRSHVLTHYRQAEQIA
ncbi:MAG: hypothetical protein AAF465_05490 [Pseudomonadota bacterium]